MFNGQKNGLSFFFFFKQKTAYEIGTGDWSSDVCSSDLYKKRGPAATRNGQYKKRGALPQRESESIKSGGAATMRDGQYKKRGDRKSVV